MVYENIKGKILPVGRLEESDCCFIFSFLETAVYLFHQTSDRWSISIYFDGTNDSYFLYGLLKSIHSRIWNTIFS